MTMNIGGGFGYGSPMMNGMSSMNGASGGNMFQYFKSKYGCEDCFRLQPYPYELAKPQPPLPAKILKQPWWQQFLNKIAG